MSDIGPIKALITDDEPVSLMLLKEMTESLSLETFEATGVSEAKMRISDAIPHIAILDIMLPDGDGVDILLAIREARLPTAVALITSTLEEFPYHKCGEFLPDIIFEKPLDPAIVLTWLREQMKHVEERMDVWEKGLIRDRLSHHDDPIASPEQFSETRARLL